MHIHRRSDRESSPRPISPRIRTTPSTRQTMIQWTNRMPNAALLDNFESVHSLVQLRPFYNRKFKFLIFQINRNRVERRGQCEFAESRPHFGAACFLCMARCRRDQAIFPSKFALRAGAQDPHAELQFKLQFRVCGNQV